MSNIFIFLVSIIFLFLITIFRAFLLKKRKDKLNNALNANYFLETINKLIDENKYNLLEERIRLKITDAYGNEDLKKWIGNPPLDEKLIENSINNGSKRFREGIPYFWKKVILKKFSDQETFFEKWKSYRKINPIINDEIIGASRILKNEDWFIFIASQIEKNCLNIIENNIYINNNQNYKK
jgi:hypothetical protein